MIESEPTAAHFRVVMPPNARRGFKTSTRDIAVFITLPGLPEVPVPRLRDIKLLYPINSGVTIRLEILGTVEVQYA